MPSHETFHNQKSSQSKLNADPQVKKKLDPTLRGRSGLRSKKFKAIKKVFNVRNFNFEILIQFFQPWMENGEQIHKNSNEKPSAGRYCLP